MISIRNQVLFVFVTFMVFELFKLVYKRFPIVTQNVLQHICWMWALHSGLTWLDRCLDFFLIQHAAHVEFISCWPVWTFVLTCYVQFWTVTELRGFGGWFYCAIWAPRNNEDIEEEQWKESKHQGIKIDVESMCRNVKEDRMKRETSWII